MNSPFSLGRFEHNSRYRHAYYLPKELHAKLAAGVPTYLIGGRGTGKTTLLKAFEWRERLNNPSLKEALGGHAFPDGIIGIYVKLSEAPLPSFERWLKTLEPDQQAVVFGLFFDLLWLEDLMVALVDLTRLQHLTLSVADERRLVAAFAARNIGQRLGIRADDSLLRVSEQIQTVRAILTQAALVRQPFAKLADDLPAAGPGEVSRTFVALLAECAPEARLAGRPVTIRVLVDEAESSTDTQQIIINSVIRLAQSPLSYIFSSIKRFQDITSTTIPNLSVQRDDCQVVPLESPRHAEFRNMAEGVAGVRLKQAGLPSFVDLRRWFGTSGINTILLDQLSDSLSANAQKLLAEARQTGRLTYLGPPGETAEPDDVDPLEESTSPDQNLDEVCPIYQVHLIRRLHLTPPAASAPYRERRQKYAEVRKKMVAAYLDICRQLKIEPRYFGAGMILAMSDGSVRDFLLQMNELYAEAGSDLSVLDDGRLTPRQQDAALRRASDQKISNLPNWVRLPHERVLRFVDTFGHLTHELQQGDEGVSHLRTSERGIFVLPKRSLGDGLDQYRDDIEACVVTGYFTAVQSTEGAQAFRVHKVLAPHYRFSYRGAYAATPIRAEHLRLIGSAKNATGEEARKLAAEIANAIRNHDDVNQLPLFT